VQEYRKTCVNFALWAHANQFWAGRRSPSTMEPVVKCVVPLPFAEDDKHHPGSHSDSLRSSVFLAYENLSCDTLPFQRFTDNLIHKTTKILASYTVNILFSWGSTSSALHSQVSPPVRLRLPAFFDLMH
jgi:hypothetical protein